MVRFITQQDYAPQQPRVGPGLGDVLGMVFQARQAAKMQQAQKEAEQRRLERQERREQAMLEGQTFERAQSHVQRQLEARKRNLEEAQTAAAGLSMAQAPAAPALSQGIPEIGAEEAGPKAAELQVPERIQTLPAIYHPVTGEEVAPQRKMPLKFREDIEGEQRRAAEQAAQAAGMKVTAEKGAAEPFAKAEDERRAKLAAQNQAAADRRAQLTVDAQQKRAEALAAGQAGKQTLQQEGKLRADYNREAKQTNDNLRDLHRSLTTGNPEVPSPLSDHALIYGFNKALDPSSVVRESEFKSAKTATGGVTDRALSMLEDLRTGKMTPEKRAQMVQVIRNAEAGERSNLENVQKYYSDLASVYEVDPGKVFVPSAAKAGDRQARGETRTKGGKTYRKVPGGWEEVS
jgi:hypothetical protein